MDACAGVGCAGPAGNEGDAGPAGHLAVGVGHIADPTLLAADDGLDLRRVVQRVEHGEKTLAWNSEDAVAALDPELLDKDLAAGACRHGPRPYPSRLARESGNPAKPSPGPALNAPASPPRAWHAGR